MNKIIVEVGSTCTKVDKFNGEIIEKLEGKTIQLKKHYNEDNTLNTYNIVTYVSTNWETEYMYVFTSNDFTGDIIECNEGELQWIDKNKISELNTWEGDKIFVEKIQKDNIFFTVKFNYNGDKLIKYDLKEY